MNILHKHIRSLLAATTVAAPLILGLISHDASAGERAAQRANAAGRTVNHNAMRKMESGTYTANSTRTGANGVVSARASTGVLDKEAGTWTRSATSTGPDGNSTFNAGIVRTDNGYVRDASRTGPDGKTSSTHTEMARTDNGRSIDSTFTGPNGKTSTRSTDVVRTDSGSERSSVLTGPDGQSAMANTVVTRTGSGIASSTVVTGVNGQTLSREGATSYDTDAKTLTRSIATTGPEGNTASFNSTTTRTEDGYVRDTTRTGLNGNTVTTNTVGSHDPETMTATRSTTVTGPQGQTSNSVTTRMFTPVP